MQENHLGQIDFLVTGVARSGTTALARYINAFQGVVCGLEYFSLGYDHRQISSPVDFVGDKNKKALYGRRVVEESLLQNNGVNNLFGNKIPHYFYGLTRVAAEIRGAKVIVTFRSPLDSAKSYNKRAGNRRDSWHVARKGLFAPFDFIALWYSIMQNPELEFFFVNSADLILRPREILGPLGRFLCPCRSLKYDDRTVSNIFSEVDRVLSAPVLPNSELEIEAFERTGASALYELLFDCNLNSPGIGSAVRFQVAAAHREAPAILIELLNRACDHSMWEYFRNVWLRHATLEVWPNEFSEYS